MYIYIYIYIHIYRSRVESMHERGGDFGMGSRQNSITLHSLYSPEKNKGLAGNGTLRSYTSIYIYVRSYLYTQNSHNPYSPEKIKGLAGNGTLRSYTSIYICTFIYNMNTVPYVYTYKYSYIKT
jgi:hypothetical protein